MTARPPAVLDQPIQDFSDCHLGIFYTLDELASLARQPGSGAQRSAAAGRVLAFFQGVLKTHHLEEERELFSAVTADAALGPEQQLVRELIERLTDEHRRLEALLAQLAPTLSDIEHGRDALLDVPTCATLVADCRAHASFEELTFLPLAQTILSRNSDHMAALGLALHIRHASQEIRQQFGAV